MAKVRSKAKTERRKFISPFKNYWNKTNYLIFYLGIFLLLLGFYLMSIGPWDNPLSLSYSPIILLVAYLIIFPLAILFRNKKKVSDVSS